MVYSLIGVFAPFYSSGYYGEACPRLPPSLFPADDLGVVSVEIVWECWAGVSGRAHSFSAMAKETLKPVCTSVNDRRHELKKRSSVVMEKLGWDRVRFSGCSGTSSFVLVPRA